jgi:hypothetical protein
MRGGGTPSRPQGGPDVIRDSIGKRLLPVGVPNMVTPLGNACASRGRTWVAVESAPIRASDRNDALTPELARRAESVNRGQWR